MDLVYSAILDTLSILWASANNIRTATQTACPKQAKIATHSPDPVYNAAMAMLLPLLAPVNQYKLAVHCAQNMVPHVTLSPGCATIVPLGILQLLLVHVYH